MMIRPQPMAALSTFSHGAFVRRDIGVAGLVGALDAQFQAFTSISNMSSIPVLIVDSCMAALQALFTVSTDLFNNPSESKNVLCVDGCGVCVRVRYRVIVGEKLIEMYCKPMAFVCSCLAGEVSTPQLHVRAYHTRKRGQLVFT
jgi:hypothetical protein